jgi:hypothetical protein
MSDELKLTRWTENDKDHRFVCGKLQQKLLIVVLLEFSEKPQAYHAKLMNCIFYPMLR